MNVWILLYFLPSKSTTIQNILSHEYVYVWNICDKQVYTKYFPLNEQSHFWTFDLNLSIFPIFCIIFLQYLQNYTQIKDMWVPILFETSDWFILKYSAQSYLLHFVPLGGATYQQLHNVLQIIFLDTKCHINIPTIPLRSVLSNCSLVFPQECILRSNKWKDKIKRK